MAHAHPEFGPADGNRTPRPDGSDSLHQSTRVPDRDPFVADPEIADADAAAAVLAEAEKIVRLEQIVQNLHTIWDQVDATVEARNPGAQTERLYAGVIEYRARYFEVVHNVTDGTVEVYMARFAPDQAEPTVWLAHNLNAAVKPLGGGVDVAFDDPTPGEVDREGIPYRMYLHIAQLIPEDRTTLGILSKIPERAPYNLKLLQAWVIQAVLGDTAGLRTGMHNFLDRERQGIGSYSSRGISEPHPKLNKH